MKSPTYIAKPSLLKTRSPRRSSPTSQIVALLFLFLLCLSCASASAPALSLSTETPSPTPTEASLQCDSGRPEDAILCDAKAQEEDTIQQVIEEDETKNVVPETPSAKNADDVWLKAYNQWVAGEKEQAKRPGSAGSASGSSGSDDHPSEAMRKAAVEAARQHSKERRKVQEAETKAKLMESHNETKGEGDEDPGYHMLENEDREPEDELELITRAAKTLSSLDASVSNIEKLSALELVNELCVSGDNGRQFEASGGIKAIVTVMRENSFDDSLILFGLRALATCAQNNKPVFVSASAVGAVPVVAKIGQSSNEVLRAAALRVLLALSDSPDATHTFWDSREDILSMILASFEATPNKAGAPKDSIDTRRCKIRSLALANACVSVDNERWASKMRDSGVLEIALSAMNDEDVDVRENAARAVQSLRKSD